MQIDVAVKVRHGTGVVPDAQFYGRLRDCGGCGGGRGQKREEDSEDGELHCSGSREKGTLVVGMVVVE